MNKNVRYVYSGAECGVLMPSGVSFTGYRCPADIPPDPVLRVVEQAILQSDAMLPPAPQYLALPATDE